MEKLKYKVGDTVRIKSLDWYNKNKDFDGMVTHGLKATFTDGMSKYCGKSAKITDINLNSYWLDIDEHRYYWEDYMLEEEPLKSLLVPGRIVEFNDGKRAMVFLNKGEKLLLYENGYDEVENLNDNLISPLGHKIMKIYETEAFGNGLNFILDTCTDNRFTKTIWERPKETIELTMDEIASKFGIPVEQLKIKK